MTAYPRRTRVFTRQHDRVLSANAFFEELNGPTPFGRMFSPDSDRLPDEAARARLQGTVRELGTRTGERLGDLALSCVVPQAGSLRGGTGALLDRWLDTVTVLASHLTARGAAVEVIGYTTTTWKGGRSVEDWKAAGRPEEPGRLCDLLHVVYKDFDEAWGEDEQHLFDLGARCGFLRENVDGEAIDFASARLMAQDRPRKMLVVFDKLYAMDETTATYNGTRFLEIDRTGAIDHARNAGIALRSVVDTGTNRAHYEPMFHPDEIAYGGNQHDYAVEAAVRALVAHSETAGR